MNALEHRTDFLSDLVLLRNDPTLVEAIEVEALNGNPHAQYAMGLIYAEGRGVALDRAQAYAWLTLAVMQGDREAEVLRNIVGVELDDAQFAQGKALAGELARKIEHNNAAH